MADGFKVKIWYHADAYEEVRAASKDNAVAIYAEAFANDRIRSAELHLPNGYLAREFDNRIPLDGGDISG